MPSETPLVSLFLPSLAGGGAERMMLDLAERFLFAGIKVNFIAVRCEGAYKDTVPKDMELICLGASRPSKAILKLVRYLRIFSPNALLSALTQANLAALVAVRIARTGTRCVVTEHASLSDTLAYMPITTRWLVPQLIKWIYPLADGIVNVSQGVADNLAVSCNLPRHRMEVVYNPVDRCRIERLAAMDASHPWLTDAGPPVIVGIGRLSVQKGFDVLLRAFVIVNRERPARLLILGEGDSRRTLETMIRSLGVENKVEMPGFARNPYAYLSRAAVFAFPSRWEGLGIALIEALGCGIPVVASDCPSGPAEVLENGRYGRLVPVGDERALAEALIDALDGQVQPAPAQALERFDPDRIARQYLRILLPEHLGQSADEKVNTGRETAR